MTNLIIIRSSEILSNQVLYNATDESNKRGHLINTYVRSTICLLPTVQRLVTSACNELNENDTVI